MVVMSSMNNVQIDYKIDEDYNEDNYPTKLVTGW